MQVLRVACLTWNQALGSASSRPAWWPEHLPRCAPPAGALLHPPNSQVAGLRGLRHIPRHHRRLAALLRLHRLHWAGSCQRRRARAAAADSAGRAHHARRAAAAVGGLHAGWGWAHRPGSANSRDERVGAPPGGAGASKRTTDATFSMLSCNQTASMVVARAPVAALPLARPSAGAACLPRPAAPAPCRLADQPGAVLLDVRPVEQFSICHLPGECAWSPLCLGLAAWIGRLLDGGAVGWGCAAPVNHQAVAGMPAALLLAFTFPAQGPCTRLSSTLTSTCKWSGTAWQQRRGVTQQQRRELLSRRVCTRTEAQRASSRRHRFMLSAGAAMTRSARWLGCASWALCTPWTWWGGWRPGRERWTPLFPPTDWLDASSKLARSCRCKPRHWCSSPVASHTEDQRRGCRFQQVHHLSSQAGRLRRMLHKGQWRTRGQRFVCYPYHSCPCKQRHDAAAWTAAKATLCMPRF